MAENLLRKGERRFESGHSPLEPLGENERKLEAAKTSRAASIKSLPRSWKTRCGQKRDLERVKGPIKRRNTLTSG
jgi:hypothetical protein